MAPNRSAAFKKIVASLAVLAAVSVFVSFGVFSAFSTTQTNTSTLKSAAFSFTQTPSNSSLLSSLTSLLLIPGDKVMKCLGVTNTGDTPFDLKVTPSFTAHSGSPDVSTLLTFVTFKVEKIGSWASPTTDGTCTGASSFTSKVSGTLAATTGQQATIDNLGTSSSDKTGYYRITIDFPDTGATVAAATSSLVGRTLDIGLDLTAVQSAGPTTYN